VAPKKYFNILKKYLAGEINLKELCETIDERLLSLRQESPELTKEEEFLSGIELICEEIKDGFRTKDELDEYIKQALIPVRSIVSR